jgi:hypothetical protein
MPRLSRRNALHLLAAAALPLVTSMPAIAGDEVPLAIKGYDPVAYFTVGKPTRGLPENEYAWDEHRYRFATPAHRDLFKADPVRYAPQFVNFCAMSLARGQVVEADPESWLIADGKLYLFGGPAGPGNFQRSLAENIAKANQNRGLIETLQR